MDTNLIGKLKTIIDHYQNTENQLNEKLENLKAENEQLKVYEQRCTALETVIGELKSNKVEMQLKIQRQSRDLDDFEAKNNNFSQAIKSNQLGPESGSDHHKLACLKNSLTQANDNNRRLKSELNRLKNVANDDKVIEVKSDKYKEELKNANVGNMRLKSGKNCNIKIVIYSENCNLTGFFKT